MLQRAHDFACDSRDIASCVCEEHCVCVPMCAIQGACHALLVCWLGTGCVPVCLGVSPLLCLCAKLSGVFQ